jgi:hypothetical protein
MRVPRLEKIPPLPTIIPNKAHPNELEMMSDDTPDHRLSIAESQYTSMAKPNRAPTTIPRITPTAMEYAQSGSADGLLPS